MGPISGFSLILCMMDFRYNTNIRHQDFRFKSAEELSFEFKHCGTELILMLHKIKEGPDAGCDIIY